MIQAPSFQKFLDKKWALRIPSDSIEGKGFNILQGPQCLLSCWSAVFVEMSLRFFARQRKLVEDVSKTGH